MDGSQVNESSAFTYKSILIMQSRLLGETSRVFANADPYCVSDYVNQYVGSHRIQLPKHGQPNAALSHREFGNLDLCRIRYGAGVQVTSPALETVFHLQILLQSGVTVSHRLSLYTLGCVHHQQCALTGGQRTGYFVTEVNMPGSIDEV